MSLAEQNFEPNLESPKERLAAPWILTMLLSALFHGVLLMYTLSPFLPQVVSEPKEKDPVEIVDYNEMLKQQARAQKNVPMNDKDKLMAETEDAKNREIDPNANFLGDHNQTAEKQSKAARVDDFRSKQGTGAKGITQDASESLPPTVTKEAKSEALSDEGDTPAPEQPKENGVKRNWKTLSLKDLSVGGDGGAIAATDDKLANVDRGERTILSTREYKFFGYYHRIKELLRQYWKPNVEHELARIWGKGHQVTAEELTTQVLVLLDQKGSISKISKLASSGYSELDEAAVAAFQSAAPFPNPPKGMLDDDGFVRIRWDFVLTTDNGPRIQFRNLGSAPQY